MIKYKQKVSFEKFTECYRNLQKVSYEKGKRKRKGNQSELSGRVFDEDHVSMLVALPAKIRLAAFIFSFAVFPLHVMT